MEFLHVLLSKQMHILFQLVITIHLHSLSAVQPWSVWRPLGYLTYRIPRKTFVFFSSGCFKSVQDITSSASPPHLTQAIKSKVFYVDLCNNVIKQAILKQGYKARNLKEVHKSFEEIGKPARRMTIPAALLQLGFCGSAFTSSSISADHQVLLISWLIPPLLCSMVVTA